MLSVGCLVEEEVTTVCSGLVGAAFDLAADLSVFHRCSC